MRAFFQNSYITTSMSDLIFSFPRGKGDYCVYSITDDSAVGALVCQHIYTCVSRRDSFKCLHIGIYKSMYTCEEIRYLK